MQALIGLLLYLVVFDAPKKSLIEEIIRQVLDLHQVLVDGLAIVWSDWFFEGKQLIWEVVSVVRHYLTNSLIIDLNL